jgi:hypothetical protein
MAAAISNVNAQWQANWDSQPAETAVAISDVTTL